MGLEEKWKACSDLGGMISETWEEKEKNLLSETLTIDIRFCFFQAADRIRYTPEFLSIVKGPSVLFRIKAEQLLSNTYTFKLRKFPGQLLWDNYFNQL